MGKASQTSAQSCGVGGICCVTERPCQGFHTGLGAVRCGRERSSGLRSPWGWPWWSRLKSPRKVPGWIINPLGQKPRFSISGSPPGCFIHSRNCQRKEKGQGPPLGVPASTWECKGKVLGVMEMEARKRFGKNPVCKC